MNKPINLNKVGVWLPDDASVRPSGPRAWLDVAHKYRAFLLIVVLPTLLAALYYGLVASDQYQSEADFIVHSSQQQRSAPTGLGQVLGLGSALDGSLTQTYSVTDYLDSHDAVAALQKQLDIKTMFQSSDIDPVSRLEAGNVTAENLLKYYRRQVVVHFDPDTGITSLKVRAFRPRDAHAIATALMNLGEQRVNDMNRRSYEAAVASAKNQFAEAQREVERVQQQITVFRQQGRDIDPQASGLAQTKMVTDLDAQVAANEAILSTMLASISPSSPQVAAQRQRLASLRAQVSAYKGRLSGDGDATSVRLGGYEDLQLKQKFAAQRYEAAAAVYEKAREDASKQQLFVARVVEANMPEKSLYPKRMQTLATIALGLLLVYAISWLIMAGVREHSA